jgi:hypothetical protein
MLEINHPSLSTDLEAKTRKKKKSFRTRSENKSNHFTI